MVRLEQLSEGQRKNTENLQCPTFKTQPWVEGPPLRKRRVAIISTAGIHHRDDRPFTRGGGDFYRVIPGSIKASDLVMSHVSSSFDRSGFQQDWNVIFPVDLLKDFAKEGIIGSVADFHYSFMGADDPMRWEQQAVFVADLLKKDKVDAVLLVPVWPNCTRAVGTLANFLEREGLPTTQISLIRLHTEKIKPPRALWVTFEFGHPLGAPNKPTFQKKVLLFALKLLEAPSGPVLEDFPEDIRISNEQPVGLACPVNIRVEDTAGGTEAEKLCAAFKNEIMSMHPWYDMAIKKRGRTTVGVSKLAPAAIGDFFCSLAEGNLPENPRQDISLVDEIRFSVEDLKAYYFEAVTAQPGMVVSSAKPLLGWFWKDTIAGKALLAVGESCLKSEDESLQRVGRGLVASSKAGNSIKLERKDTD